MLMKRVKKRKASHIEGKKKSEEQNAQLRLMEERIKKLEEQQKALLDALRLQRNSEPEKEPEENAASQLDWLDRSECGSEGPLSIALQFQQIFEEACAQAVARAEAWTAERTPAGVMALEEEIAKQMREAGDRVTGVVIQAILGDKEWEHEVVSRLKGTGLRNVGRKAVEISQLGGGSVNVKVPYLGKKKSKTRGRKRGRGKRGKGGTGLYPTLLILGVIARCTPALACDVTRQAVSYSSYSEAKSALACRGISMDEKTMRRIVLTLGKEALENRDRLIDRALQGNLRTKEWKGKRVVVAVDGGRMRIRIPKKRGRIPKGNKRRRFWAEWREPKIMVAYIIDEMGNRQRSYPVILDGTLQNADAVFRLMVGYLKLMGVSEAEEMIVIGDGARWIWNRIDELVRDVGIDFKRVTAVVDFYHAVEHLKKVVDLCKGWSVRRRKQWLNKHRNLLREGKIEQVLSAIEKLCKGRRSKKMRTELNYFEKNEGKMQYKMFESKGIPLGSGAVESAIRRVVNLRMKGNSIFWLEENGESFLHLRCAYKAGRFRDRILDVLNGCITQANVVASHDNVIKINDKANITGRYSVCSTRKAA